MKLVIQTALGIVALVGGIALLYFFISSLNSGFNFIFLILSIILLSVGAFLFFKVSKIANSIPEPSVEVVPAESGSKLIEKNNQLVKDWTQANSKKDNLKAVQLVVSAEVQTKSEQ